jgi:integrase
MSVYKKGNNWYIDYYVKGQRKRRKVGPSKKLALQVLEDVHVKVAKEEYLGIFEEKKALFEDFSKQYLEYSKANKALSSYERDITSMVHLAPFFGGRYLFDVTPELIEKYKVARLQKVQPAAVNRELACLKHMYTKAIAWGYVKVNPAKSVKLLKEPPGRLRYLKPDEIENLLASCPRHIRPVVLTAINTGMRRGEIFNLKWRDLDLENRKLTVVNAKNNESRVIPINQTLYEEFRALLKEANGEYVFSRRNAEPLKDIRTGFAAALTKAKIKDFRFHDLRHTFGSHLVMQGVNLRTVQQLMGHKDIKMTMRYSHLSPEHVQQAVEKLDNLWTLFGHQRNSKSEQLLVNA